MFRKDLHKKLVEDGAYKGYVRSSYKALRRRYKTRDLEDSPKTESMNKNKLYGLNSKLEGDKWSILRRQLKANVGRLWDEVYSDLCEKFDKRSTMKYHVHQHVDIEVDKDVYVDEKGLIRDKLSGSISFTPSSFYVDEEGILREINRKKYKYSDSVGGLISRSKMGLKKCMERGKSCIFSLLNRAYYFDGDKTFYELQLKDIDYQYPEMLVSYYSGQGFLKKKIKGENYWVGSNYQVIKYCSEDSGCLDIFFGQSSKVTLNYAPVVEISLPNFCLISPEIVVELYGRPAVCVGKKEANQLQIKAIQENLLV